MTSTRQALLQRRAPGGSQLSISRKDVLPRQSRLRPTRKPPGGRLPASQVRRRRLDEIRKLDLRFERWSPDRRLWHDSLDRRPTLISGTSRRVRPGACRPGSCSAAGLRLPVPGNIAGPLALRRVRCRMAHCRAGGGQVGLSWRRPSPRGRPGAVVACRDIRGAPERRAVGRRSVVVSPTVSLSGFWRMGLATCGPDHCDVSDCRNRRRVPNSATSRVTRAFTSAQRLAHRPRNVRPGRKRRGPSRAAAYRAAPGRSPGG